MSAITTHVLDTSTGRPASGVVVHLEHRAGGHWESVGRAETDVDGRARLPVRAGVVVVPGVYRMSFDTASHFARTDTATFYPEVTVIFTVGGDAHYHVPLLISPYGYSTYRGS